MLTKMLGHFLFPRLPAWEQEKRTTTALLVLLAMIGFIVLLGGFLYWMNVSHF